MVRARERAARYADGEMATLLLNTTSSFFRELVGNGRSYRVPRFQRDYSWGEEEWDDLWNDLAGLNDEKFHYMGYVVLQRLGDATSKQLELIDGQQRFATLSILALAGLRILEDLVAAGQDADRNRQRQEVLRDRFIGFKEPASLTTRSKLILNRNNDSVYQSYLVQLREPPGRSSLKKSDKALRDAYRFFQQRFRTRFGANLKGEDIAAFLEERVADRLLFSVIELEDNLSAYQVFETLNARGVKLSSTDLLKNHLFSVIEQASPADLDQAERLWHRLVAALGDADVPTFVRHFWNAREQLERKTTLFKAIKTKTTTAAAAMSLLEDLDRVAPFYVALSRPGDQEWTPEQRRWIRALQLFNVTSCYPLLISAHERGTRWSPDELAALLKQCAVIAFRYSVISGLNPNVMESAYNEAALKVRAGRVERPSQVFPDVRHLYVTDDLFQANFARKSMSAKAKRRLVRYILLCLEEELTGKQHDLDAADITIEHILPENAGPEWDADFPPQVREDYVERLANYSPLEATLNRDCEGKGFPEKSAIYKRSAFELTRGEIIATDWNPETLLKRQERLAKLAAQKWRLDY